ncbi:MAG TPA: terminase small subunit [Candidatus Aminicenantes bacterium]|nr:terminase small subunit [Candidatus Aminicenantes bacterium]
MDPAEQPITPGNGPLRNMRHEQFAQAYAGEAWGNAAEAYRQAGYHPKNARVAANSGLRLMGNAGIRGRIRELRSSIEDRLHIDRLCLASQRWKIARDASATAGERLAAMRDLEKALGWSVHDKVDVEVNGLRELLAEIDGTSRGVPAP